MRFVIIPLFFLILTFTSASYAQQGILNRVQNFSTSQSGAPGENKTKEKRSPDSAKVAYFLPSYFGSYTLEKVVRSLSHFQEYDPSLFQNATLGNSGLAENPILFDFNTANGFRTGLNSFDPNHMLPDSVRFYSNNAPYTDLVYMMGRAKEQKLTITHNQQIRKGLFIGLNGRFSQSTGIYDHQATKYSGINFNARYITQDQRYSIMGYYLNDRNKLSENGGILYDSVFTQNLESNRKTFLVRLNDAQNRQKNGSVFIQQYFNILKPRPVKKDLPEKDLPKKVTLQKDTLQKRPLRNDTLEMDTIHKTDSIITETKFRRFDAGRIVHTFQYSRETGGYSDNSPLDQQQSFYPVILAKQVSILDSLSHIRIENTFTYTNFEPDTTNKEFPFQYAFGIQQKYNKIYQIRFKPTDDTLISPYKLTSYELIPFGSLKGIIAHRFYFVASGKYVLSGYDGGDFDLTGDMKQLFGNRGKTGQVSVQLSLGQVHPAWYLQHFTSELFNWNNNLSAQGYIKLKGIISLKGWNISASANEINNFAYLGIKATPVQASKALLVTSINFQKDILAGHWLIAVDASAQKSTNDTVLPLPLLKINTTLGFNLVLFKKALHTQFGLHLHYNSRYCADAYMPALHSFYRQYDNKYGNYPYVDVFLNIRVKRARMFLMYQHVNAMLGDYRYFMSPHYPQPDAALKFGISWVFFD